MAKRASLKSSNQETWGESSSRETCPRQVLGETTHATRDSVAKTPYFPKTISCLPVIMGETGAIQGTILARRVLERWRQYRTNIGRVPRGFPKSTSGLIMEDFTNRTLPLNHSCVARSSRLDPPSGEVSRCLALIPGESRNSGRGLGFDARANLDRVKNDFLGS
jgi:hypothetical protein